MVGWVALYWLCLDISLDHLDVRKVFFPRVNIGHVTTSSQLVASKRRVSGCPTGIWKFWLSVLALTCQNRLAMEITRRPSRSVINGCLLRGASSDVFLTGWKSLCDAEVAKLPVRNRLGTRALKKESTLSLQGRSMFLGFLKADGGMRPLRKRLQTLAAS